ncbi:MAG: shikimate dehydrogenase [Pseudomonadales bacterium]|jgi:shikimate dehydrogenase|nr:shikimate dehydrogenase [Pseudomonadales bacterium]
MDRYCVIGNPIEHSLSPQIHQEFAAQTGELLTYEKVKVELTGFADFLKDFANSGGKGLNITVPFKVEAFNGATQLHELADIANAVNTLSLEGAEIIGFNTDGLGFIRDLTQRHGVQLAGKSVLVLGAGGACRGIIEPLLSTNPAQVTIANRTLANAQALCELFSGRHRHNSLSCVDLSVLAEGDAGTYDLVVNTTSLGLSANGITLPASLAQGSFCYDMSYGDKAAFARWAKEQGALNSVDGLGMLVEQAAESFNIWRGVRPRTDEIYQSLRKRVGV